MGTIAAPFFSIRLGSSDQGNDPTTMTTRRAYDLLAQGFGAGFNGPLQVVAAVPSPADVPALNAFRASVVSTADVKGATPPQLSPDGKAAIIVVYPASSPQDQATTDLISHVRNDLATFQDFASVLTSKLPLFIGVVIALAVLLLIVAFRNLVVPLTAALMNLLSTGAAFGIVVLVFQQGWLAGPLGVGKPGPIDSFLPVFLFAILFGLSMDYEVFLVSRIREEWMHSRDNRRAVTVGQGETGRVITAAALIMATVFMSFAFGSERAIKLFGIGLGAGVLLDAFVVRTLLVPSLMQVLGKANWYLPAWMDRILPRLSIEPAVEAELAGRTMPVSKEAEVARR
jgi:RND superfamily putative drug exporter